MRHGEKETWKFLIVSLPSMRTAQVYNRAVGIFSESYENKTVIITKPHTQKNPNTCTHRTFGKTMSSEMQEEQRSYLKYKELQGADHSIAKI